MDAFGSSRRSAALGWSCATAPVASAVDDLLLIWAATAPEEWVDQNRLSAHLMARHVTGRNAPPPVSVHAWRCMAASGESKDPALGGSSTTSIRLLRRYRGRGSHRCWDALIVAAAARSSATRVLSEDLNPADQTRSTRTSAPAAVAILRMCSSSDVTTAGVVYRGLD
jgi:hypothetical protein